MRTFVYVWVWFAFSILGFTFLPKAETFAVTQNSQSNFSITRSSEIYTRTSSDLSAGLPTNRIPLEDRIGMSSAKVLGLLQIAAYNAEIYNETSTFSISSSRNKIHAKWDSIGSIQPDNPNLYTDIYCHNLLKDNFKVDRVEILSQDIIRLTFSDFPEPSTVILPDRYKVSGIIPSNVVLLENLYQLDIHLSQSLQIGDNVDLIIKNIQAETGSETSDFQISLTYTDAITEVYAKDKNTIHLSHDLDISENHLDLSAFKILDGNYIFELLHSSTPQVLQLKVSPELEEGLLYQLVLPTRTSLDGKIISGSIRNLLLDKTPPLPVHFKKYDRNKIIIEFDEAIDPVMAVVPQHYSVNGHTPTEIILLDIPQKVLLVMGEALLEEETLELSISHVEDMQGNAMSKTVILSPTLRNADEPSYKSIVINEVMAAPRAGLVLPNSEYVELLNLSNNEINISGFRLHNSRSSTAIPGGTIIFPGEYLILCPNARRGLFEPYGRTVGLTSWPTLLNNADIVMLYNREGSIIDSLGYTRSNYGSTQMAQGGYSLEVVNPYSQCNLPSNLRPSTSPFLGTPGAINSIFDDTPDRTQPVLTEVTAVAVTEVVAHFSKPMSFNIGIANWSIYPDIGIINAEFINGGQTQIKLNLAAPLAEQTHYTLKVTNIRDCFGNLINPDGSIFTFALPAAAAAGDIVINEILFNPHTGTPKFVEIHNVSDKYINLRNWKLGNESNGMISNRRVISGNDMVMPPDSYRAITTDTDMLSQMYPTAKNLVDLGTLPSYPIREGTVFLLNPDEDLVERLDYHENFHHPLLRVPRGVSLERINPSQMPNDPQNWTSAAGAAGYATPGYKNSQMYSTDDIAEGITVSPEVFAPETSGAPNYTTIQYQMEDPGYIGTIKIFDISGKHIKNIVQNEIWGSNGFYLWNGTDMNGQKVKVGYYIIWVELLNLEGKVINIKKTVAVGTKMR